MTVSGAGSSRRALSSSTDAELFALVQAGDSGASQELVERHRGLAVHLAAKYASRPDQLDELIHVATIGLYQAVKRFDVNRGVTFATFAVPTILGEIRQHFRSTSHTVRLPRRVTSLGRAATRTADDLRAKMGRDATTSEIAAELGVTDDELLEALDATRGGTSSIDELDESVASQQDDSFDLLETREELVGILAELPERQRQVVLLRYVDELSQDQIAEQLGMSQMHVSRLLRQSLAILKGRTALA